ncbi:MAG TPA: TIGR03560 family F420-dependent LLM class oxidoreductase [Dehalococcoidia bacterium]|nr:TIGR03560 family F420-dependent LLM class oxidoreductase [Dehalococcoidia bacterium]
MAATTQQYHFGVSLPQISRTWEETCRAAETFDRLGYDSVWLNDHLYGVPRPDIPILEAWTTLSAVGAITKSVQLGTVVSPPGFRNPALMAKIVATLDQITNGRVILGMGAGWFAQEFRGYGFDFPETKVRLQQLAEAAEIARRAWTEPGLTYQGKHFRTENLILAPGPVRQPHPPILIGGSGEKVTLRIAARFADIWNNPAGSQGRLAQKVEALKEHCQQVGRNFDEITISQQTLVLITRSEEDVPAMIDRAARIFGGHMGDPRGPLALAGTPDTVAKQIQKHAELGCRYFIIEFFGRDTREPAELFAETVMPRFR